MSFVRPPITGAPVWYLTCSPVKNWFASTLTRAPPLPTLPVETMLRMFVMIRAPLPLTPPERTLPDSFTIEVVPIGLSILPLTVTSPSLFSMSMSVGATVRWMLN